MRLANGGSAVGTESTIQMLASGTAFTDFRYTEIAAVNANGSTSTDLVFRISNGAPATEAMRIAASGGGIVNFINMPKVGGNSLASLFAALSSGPAFAGVVSAPGVTLTAGDLLLGRTDQATG